MGGSPGPRIGELALRLPHISNAANAFRTEASPGAAAFQPPKKPNLGSRARGRLESRPSGKAELLSQICGASAELAPFPPRIEGRARARRMGGCFVRSDHSWIGAAISATAITAQARLDDLLLHGERRLLCARCQPLLMIGVKSLQFSIRKPRMSRTTRGNHGRALSASRAANRFAMSSFFIT